jgi:chemotaxis signal transduction protein
MNDHGVDWGMARLRLDRLARSLDDEARHDAAVMQRRAARLAKPPAPAAAADTAGFVVFRRGRGRFGAPLAQVRETPALRTLLRVPAVPPHILGLALAKGQPLPVVELGWFLDEGMPVEAPAAMLVAELPGLQFALAADRIEGVAMVRRGAAAAALQHIGKVRPFVLGITEDMLTLVDLEALAGDARFVVNDEVGGRAG